MNAYNKPTFEVSSFENIDVIHTSLNDKGQGTDADQNVSQAPIPPGISATSVLDE